MEVSAKTLWLKDEKKRKFAEQLGYYVVYLWEHEIKQCKKIHKVL